MESDPLTGHIDQTRSDITWLGTRLQHLQTLSETLAGARTEQEAIEATLNPGLDVFEADQAVIAMLDESSTVFRIVAVSGYPDQVEADWSMFPNSDEFPLSDCRPHPAAGRSCTGPRS